MTRYNNVSANFGLYYFAISITIIFSLYMIIMFSSILYDINISSLILRNVSVEQISKNIIVNSLPIVKYFKEDTIKGTDQDIKIKQDSDEDKDVAPNELEVDITKFDQAEKNIIEAYKNSDTIGLEKMINSIYLFESTVAMTPESLKLDKLLAKNLATNLVSEKPKILIFHTHSQETFADSRKGVEDDSVIGVGSKLAEILKKKYNISVLHHKGKYDIVNDKLHRDGSYERMEVEILKILKENPSIEVIIDLHRDGIPDNTKLLTEVNNKPTAKIMFVNGLCEKITNGKMQKISNLPNQYVTDNLAFSLKMQLEAKEKYPGFVRKMLIKPYRYSLFMKPKSLLVEVGAQTNTISEAKNAMEPLADLVYEVLKK